MSYKPKKGTVFIDFDGTIIDNIQRQYMVYQNVAAGLGLTKTLKKSDYWQCRRSGVSFAMLFNIKHAIADIALVQKKYKQLIEKRDYLNKDKLISRAIKELQKLSKDYNLVLVSLRSRRNNFYWQLRELGIGKIFSDIKVGSAEGGAVKTKVGLIKKSRFYGVGNRYLIGDTEVDIQAGQKAGCDVITVYSGIRSSEYLRKYSPAKMVSDISKIDLAK